MEGGREEGKGGEGGGEGAREGRGGKRKEDCFWLRPSNVYSTVRTVPCCAHSYPAVLTGSPCRVEENDIEELQ